MSTADQTMQCKYGYYKDVIKTFFSGMPYFVYKKSVVRSIVKNK